MTFAFMLLSIPNRLRNDCAAGFEDVADGAAPLLDW